MNCSNHMKMGKTPSVVINKFMDSFVNDDIRLYLNREEWLVITNTSKWHAKEEDNALILTRRGVSIKIPYDELERFTYSSKLFGDGE